MIILVCNFIVPGTIVLNLPEQSRIRCFVAQQPHRQILFCRPVSRIINFNRLRGSSNALRLCHRESQIRKGVFLPVQFLLPSIVRDIQTIALFLQSWISKRGKIGQHLFLRTLIDHSIDKTCHWNIIIKLNFRIHAHIGKRISLPDRKFPSIFISGIFHGFVQKETAWCCHNILISMSFIRSVITG